MFLKIILTVLHFKTQQFRTIQGSWGNWDDDWSEQDWVAAMGEPVPKAVVPTAPVFVAASSKAPATEKAAAKQSEAAATQAARAETQAQAAAAQAARAAKAAIRGSAAVAATESAPKAGKPTDASPVPENIGKSVLMDGLRQLHGIMEITTPFATWVVPFLSFRRNSTMGGSTGSTLSQEQIAAAETIDIALQLGLPPQTCILSWAHARCVVYMFCYVLSTCRQAESRLSKLPKTRLLLRSSSIRPCGQVWLLLQLVLRTNWFWRRLSAIRRPTNHLCL